MAVLSKTKQRRSRFVSNWVVVSNTCIVEALVVQCIYCTVLHATCYCTSMQAVKDTKLLSFGDEEEDADGDGDAGFKGTVVRIFISVCAAVQIVLSATTSAY